MLEFPPRLTAEEEKGKEGTDGNDGAQAWTA